MNAPTSGTWAFIESPDKRRDGFIRRSEDVGVPGRMAIGQAFKGNLRLDEYHANGRLMAAAPELLIACTNARDTFAEFETAMRALGRHALADACKTACLSLAETVAAASEAAYDDGSATDGVR